LEKSEIRSTKSGTNTRHERRKPQTTGLELSSWSERFVSDFVLRIADFHF
jgi:hypothetical protein